MFDSVDFYSKSPQMLINAHKLLEKYIEEYAAMADIEAEMMKAYRVKRADLLRKSREMSIPVSIASEIAKGECAKEKAEYLKATANKKAVQYKISAIQDKIYSIRSMNKSIEGQIKAQ